MICKSLGLAGLLLYLIRKAYITRNGQVQNFVMQSLMLDNSFSSFQVLTITLNVFLLLHLFRTLQVKAQPNQRHIKRDFVIVT